MNVSTVPTAKLLGLAGILFLTGGFPVTAQLFGTGDAPPAEAPADIEVSDVPAGAVGEMPPLVAVVRLVSLGQQPQPGVAGAPPSTVHETSGEAGLEILVPQADLAEAPTELSVRIQPPSGAAVTVTVPFRETVAGDPRGSFHLFFAKVDPQQVAGGPIDSGKNAFSIFATTDNGDAGAFRSALVGAQGRGGLPTREASNVHQVDSGAPPAFGANQTMARDVFSRGGTRVVKYSVAGVSGLSGELHFRDTPSWIYYSGHYGCGSGGFLPGGTVHPRSVDTEWDGVDVTIFASCYAVDVAASLGEVKQVGAGTDGLAWWKRFRGTLLGYRGTAPSAGASEIASRFVRAAMSLQSPPAGAGAEEMSDYSRQLSWAWMQVNNSFGATNASAIDRAGTFYKIERRKVVEVPRSEWKPGNDDVVAQDDVLSPLIGDIRQELFARHLARPAPLGEVVGTRSVAEALASESFQALRGRLQSEGLIAAGDDGKVWLQNELSKWLDYQRHLFFETELRPTPADVVQMYQAVHQAAPSAQQLADFYRARPDDVAALQAWRRRTGRGGRVSLTPPSESDLREAAAQGA